jgi:predicted transcriptional regulator
MELVTIRLPDDVKEKLEKIAQADHRPLSNLLRLIILEWLEEQDKKPKPKK